MPINIEEAPFSAPDEPYASKQFQAGEKPSHGMLEPGLVYRFGWPVFKFQLSGNYSANLTTPELQSKCANFGAGMPFPFNTSGKGGKKMKYAAFL